MTPCARCGFELSDSATKCLFCGHVVGAALPAAPTPPTQSAASPAPETGGRIPKPTVPYRRPDDLDVEAASTPPSSPLLRPGFGSDAPASQPAGEAAPVGAPPVAAPVVDAMVGPPPVAAPPVAPASPRGSMMTTLVIAALVGAIAGGLGFLIFVALRG